MTNHGLTLVANQATLDGEPVNMRDVFMSKDPAIWGLVSDEGPFDPSFPNSGGGIGAMSTMAFDRFSDGDDSPAGEAKAAETAGKGAGMLGGAIVGLAGGLMLSIPVPWVIAAPIAGALLGRIFGGRLVGKDSSAS
jgi:hypothetical protein